jgi:hypothetical protein
MQPARLWHRDWKSQVIKLPLTPKGEPGSGIFTPVPEELRGNHATIAMPGVVRGTRTMAEEAILSNELARSGDLRQDRALAIKSLDGLVTKNLFLLSA